MKLQNVTETVSRIQWLDKQRALLRGHVSDVRTGKVEYIKDNYGNLIYADPKLLADFLERQYTAYTAERADLAKQLNIED